MRKISIDFFFIDKMEHTLKNWFDNTQIWCDNKSIMEFGRLPEWFSIRSRGIWKMVKINCMKFFRQIRIFRRNFQFISLETSMMTGDLWRNSWEKPIFEELLGKFFYRKKKFMTGNLEILFIKFIMRSILHLKTERESCFVLIKTITLNDKNRFNLVNIRFSSPSTSYEIFISSISYEIFFRV